MSNARQEAFSTLNKGIMNFPESHMWNKGGVFASVDFEEWYTWNGILKDSKTDELYSLYISFYQIVKDGKLTYPYSVSLYNVKNESLVSVTGDCPKLTTNRDVVAGDFTFCYEVPKHWSVSYASKQNTWDIAYKLKHDKFNFDLQIASDDRKNRWSSLDGILPMGRSAEMAYRPDKVKGLAFAYFNPHQKADIVFSFDDKEDLALTGELWFNHQWGNFRNNNFNYETYNTFNLKLKDSTCIEMRNWYTKTGELNSELNSLVMYQEGKIPRFFKGEGAYQIKPVKQVSLGGKGYELGWCLELDSNKYYMTPFSDEQSHGYVDRRDGSFWEGFGTVREGSPEGEIVGDVFMELMGR